MKVMQEEIFGPLLPVIPYERLEDALAYVNQRPRPLALYYFGYDKAQQQRVLHETHSGGVSERHPACAVAQDDIRSVASVPPAWATTMATKASSPSARPRACSASRASTPRANDLPALRQSIQKLVYKLFVR